MKTSKLEMSHSSQLLPIDKEIYSAKGETTIKRLVGIDSTDSVVSVYQLRIERIKKRIS
jgi:hypothetical protein